MTSGDQYEARARECIEAADRLTRPENRLALLELARRWMRLAFHLKIVEDRKGVIGALLESTGQRPSPQLRHLRASPEGTCLPRSSSLGWGKASAARNDAGLASASAAPIFGAQSQPDNPTIICCPGGKRNPKPGRCVSPGFSFPTAACSRASLLPCCGPMEQADSFWRTRTVGEAEAQGYTHLRATCSGCGRITDIPFKLLVND